MALLILSGILVRYYTILQETGLFSQNNNVDTRKTAHTLHACTRETINFFIREFGILRRSWQAAEVVTVHASSTVIPRIFHVQAGLQPASRLSQWLPWVTDPATTGRVCVRYNECESPSGRLRAGCCISCQTHGNPYPELAFSRKRWPLGPFPPISWHSACCKTCCPPS